MDIEKVILDNIDATVHMSLATVVDNQPWVSELHFAYDDKLNLYFRSLKSRRHSLEIELNPNVAGNIVRQHALDEVPLGLYFEGTARLISAGAEQNLAFRLLHDRVNAAEDAIAEASRQDGHQFYKITVENWYVFGQFVGHKGKKYTLKMKGAGGFTK